MRDAAAIIGCRAPRRILLCVGKRHGELRFLKCCIGHIVQLMDRLLVTVKAGSGWTDMGQ